MTLLDLLIVVAYLGGVIAVGARFARRQKTTAHYFVGDRRMPWWAIAASIVATETSTITFLSVPAIAYARGGNLTFLQLPIGYVVGRAAVALLFMPAYFKGELLTVYQLLASRFGGAVKGLSASLFIATRTVGDGIRLLLTGIVLAQVAAQLKTEKALVSAASLDTAVAVAVVAIGLVLVAFTLWGGMEAVVWIEVVQLFLYLGGAAAAAWVLAGKIPGGLGGALDLAREAGKLRVFDFSLALAPAGGSYATFWAALFGGALLTMSTHGTDQYLVQRYLTTDRPSRAAAALLTSGVVVLLQFGFFLVIGLLLFAHYRPDALPGYATASRFLPFERPDDVFGNFISKELPTGLAGLVVAAILAAALSSSLNAVAAAGLNDLYRPLRPGLWDRHYLNASRLFTLLAGLAQIGVALAVSQSRRSALDAALAAASLFNGPILGVFLLGTFTKRAGKAAALVGMAAGLAASVAVWKLTALPWLWYAAVGSLTTLAVGGVAGLFAAPPAGENGAGGPAA